MSDIIVLDHTEATELAGLFVLDALEPPLRSAVVAHLARCPDAHLEFDELGGVLPTLALLAETIEAPAALRGRILAAVRELAVGRG